MKISRREEYRIEIDIEPAYGLLHSSHDRTIRDAEVMLEQARRHVDGVTKNNSRVVWDTYYECDGCSSPIERSQELSCVMCGEGMCNDCNYGEEAHRPTCVDCWQAVPAGHTGEDQ